MDPLTPNALPTKDSQIESLQRLIAEQQATIRDRERERDEALEWKNSIRGLIASLIKKNPTWDHEWAGDRDGWGFNFEWIKWIFERAKAAEKERDELQCKLEECERRLYG